MPTLPNDIIAVLAAFAPLFTARTFAHAPACRAHSPKAATVPGTLEGDGPGGYDPDAGDRMDLEELFNEAS